MRVTRERWCLLAGWLAVVPPLLLAVLILRFSVNVLYWDEWDEDYAGLFEKAATGHLSLGDLCVQHNEARPFFPRVLMLVLLRLSHGDVRYEMLATFVFACLVVLMIFRLQWPRFAGHPSLRVILLFLSAMLVFSPAHYEAWLWGMCDANFMPLVCLATGLVAARLQAGAWSRLWLCAGLSFVSTYSIANGFLCWFLLFPALFWSANASEFRNRNWAIGSWVGAFLLCEILYFRDFHAPYGEKLTDLWLGCLTHPWRTARFFFCFLGGPLAIGAKGPEVLATIIGAAMVLLFACICVGFFRARKAFESRSQAWPWFALAAFSLLSAGLATSSRSAQYGVEEALSSRYGLFALGLMLGLIHLIPIADLRLMESNWLPNWQHLRKPLLWTLAVTVCLLQLLAFPEGVWGMRKTRADRLLGKTCLAFVDILPDQPAVTRVLYHTPPQLKRAVASLTKLGLLNPPPFISSPTNLFPAAPQRTGGTKVPGVAWEGSLGQLEQLRWGQKGQFTVTGWAIAPSQKDMSDGVVLTCQTGNDIPRLLGVMDYRVLRSDLGVLWGRDPYLYAGWQKTFSLYDVPDGQLVFRAWVYDAERQTAFPLDGEESLGK